MVRLARSLNTDPDRADGPAVDGALADRGGLPEPSLPRDVALLYVATVPAPIRNFLIPYAEHFRRRGWRVDAAANGASSLAALRDAFDHVYELPLSRSILDMRAIISGERAMEALLDSGPDIVHVHTPIAAFVTRVAVRRAPVHQRPAIAYTAHGFHFHRDGNPVANTLFLTAERLAGRWTDRLVVINAEDREAAEHARIVPGSRLVRMPGVGVDTARYSGSCIPPSDVAEARKQLGIGLETPLFVVVGELHPNKRQADVIAALAAMRHRECHLVLLGEGRERARLEAVCARLWMQGRVRFVGFVEDVRPILASATALVLASAREGLSRSVMEALALEVPVIATTARGNRELLGDDCGLVVPTGDVRALANAMDRLVEHPAEALAMGRSGRARMVERYDLRFVIRQHEQMYGAMLAGRVGAFVRGRPAG